MKSLRLMVSLILSLGGLYACGGDEDDHDFTTYIECYEHQVEEGVSDVGATTECDAHFEVTHADMAGCMTDHETDVTAGVPQTAIDAHCAAI